ncbi:MULTISPECIES: hypothetical protein [unclassified Nocardia]|uniref:hypothetical protein n=1 Tax=unclassified Nocardia TaxID=2637762 RepID=UPI001CE3D2B2|nr:MULTISPECIES: hypothetical protein [unclassified Nocardia]
MNRKSCVRASVLLAAALLGLATAACGGSDNGAAQANTSAKRTSAANTPVPETKSSIGREFTADPTIVGAHPISFESWRKVAEDKIAVNFQVGAPECYGVDASVTETDKAVTVELRSGTRADATGRMCTMIAVFGTLELPLKSPLGNRQVLSAV